jgi:hypothetical protein
MATARRQLGYVSSLTTQTTFVTGVYGVATGGSSSSITVGGQNYTLLTFTSTGTLTVSQAGVFDVLVCGGGGGAFAASGTFYTGGGGGGWSQSTIYIDASQTVTVGGGGTTASSTTGGTSSIGTLFVVGGGGNCDSALDTSLCGASNGGARTPPGTTRNFVTGHGTGGAGVYRAGCGAGGISTSDTVGGAGKDVGVFIGGSTLYKSVGGVANAATAGGANTGNGGGATSAPSSATGGSGIVYVRFKV